MGVWATLFQEEKTDLVSTIINTVNLLVNFALEVPCVILTFLSAGITSVVEMANNLFNQAADTVHLYEWWGVEHSIFALAFVACVPAIYRRGRGDWHHNLCEVMDFVAQMMWLGSFCHFAVALQVSLKNIYHTIVYLCHTCLPLLILEKGEGVS